jgi:hypothetical protein
VYKEVPHFPNLYYKQILFIVSTSLQVAMSTHSTSLNFCKQNYLTHNWNDLEDEKKSLYIFGERNSYTSHEPLTMFNVKMPKTKLIVKLLNSNFTHSTEREPH